ncbi:hypothetical protein B5F18_04230 [Lachnoclostridium sp. An181]|nr:hypothetical protein B5F18_04230 [Lachnoclostridium sp. An181]
MFSQQQIFEAVWNMDSQTISTFCCQYHPPSAQEDRACNPSQSIYLNLCEKKILTI